MKIKKNFFKVLILLMVLTMGLGTMPSFAWQEIVNEEDKLKLKIEYQRYSNGSWKDGYALNTVATEGNSHHPIFQILSSTSNTNYFCLNATAGDTWNNATVGTYSTYNRWYDLNLKDDINALKELKNGEESEEDKFAVYSNIAKSENLNQILWILDNMYVPVSTNTTDENLEQKQKLFSQAGIKYQKIMESDLNGNEHESPKPVYIYPDRHGKYIKIAKQGKFGYEYVATNGETVDVILPDELVEVVEQAALWYFTNGQNDTTYNAYTDPDSDADNNWLVWSNGETNITNTYTWNNALANYKVDGQGAEAEVGRWYQEQACILYDYLVDAANEYAEKVEHGEITDSDSPLSISPSTANIEEKTVNNVNSYVVGPILIKKEKEKVYAFDETNPIAVNGSNSTGAYISDANGTKQTSQEVNDYVGKDLYITVPVSKITGNTINISFDGTYTTNEKILWISTKQTEQPVVEVTPGSRDFELEVNAKIENNKEFDLALRKQIVKLTDSKGVNKFITNEDGKPAERNMTIQTDTIAGPDTTATYKHRKDPVVVENGDIVEYEISVYNEGDKKGYATKIVDRLPNGIVPKEYAQENKTTGKVSGWTSNPSENYTGGVMPSKWSYTYNPDENTVTFINDTPTTLYEYSRPDAYGISTEYFTIECEVIATPSATKNTYLTNIAYIAEEHNSEDNIDIINQDKADRDSKPGTHPNSEQVTTGDEYNGYKGNTGNQSVYDDTTNGYYYRGQEDDDDFEVVVIKPAEFDLALQKYISSVYSKGKTKAGRQGPTIDTTGLANKTATTAKYTQDKTPIKVKNGDYVTYTFTVYNEGEIDGYVKKITDNIPEGVEFVYQKDNDGKTLITCDSEGNSSEIEVDKEIYDLVATNSYWEIDKDENKIKKDTYNGKSTTSITCDVESAIPPMVGSLNSNAGGHLTAYNKDADPNRDGKGLDRLSVQVVYRVTAPDAKGIIIRNEAAITGATDKDGNVQDDPEGTLRDRDSQVTKWEGKDGDKNYQDDEDFDNIILGKVDLALTKFIVAISDDMKFEDGEYLTKDTTSKDAGKESNPYTRQTAVDTTPLKQGGHDAIYTQVKTPLTIPEQSYVLYNIRVYNEGEVDVFAGEVTDYLPNYLDYVSCEFNDSFGWNVEKDGKTVRTSYLAYTKNKEQILKAFDKEKDDGKGSKLDYKDLQILCRVNSIAPEETKLINTAEITKYQDEDGEDLPEDIDSKPGNVPEKNVEKRVEDDDDYEVVLIKKKKIDIALSKFIAAISPDTTIEDGEYVTADGKQGSKQNPYLRATKVDTTPLKAGEHDAIYTKDKTPIVVPAQSYVLYDIRVYNEGEVDMYAGKVTDYLPENLDYVSCEFNDNFGWNVEKDGKTIWTEHLGFKNGEQNLLNAFDKVNDDGAGSGLDYRDLQILCRVSKDAPSNTNIVNVAEITKYEDEDGEDVTEDVDSEPDNVDKENEDDDDYEVVLVKTFDLALLKWVSTVYVTEDGVTKTTQTGNTGDDNTDIIPKVEINRKKINSTVVKFGYTIKITNEGDIAGAATEITDYVPQGLKFYKEDNNGWDEKEDGVITTRLLENTILEPGESAEVTVIFRWINGANNLGLKTNIAEISEDFNKEGIPDKDSTPGNKVWGEDDIDDAQVILSISTGLVGHIIMYTTFGLVILAVFAGGIIGIKKFVL